MTTYTVSDLYNPHYTERQGTVVEATGPVQAVRRASEQWKLKDAWKHDLAANFVAGQEEGDCIAMRVEVRDSRGRTAIYSLRLNLVVHFKAVKED